MSKDNPRIAVLGFAIECNRFSPVSTKEDFETDVDIRGNRIVTEARAEASIMLPDTPGFFAEKSWMIQLRRALPGSGSGGSDPRPSIPRSFRPRRYFQGIDSITSSRIPSFDQTEQAAWSVAKLARWPWRRPPAIGSQMKSY